MYADELRSTFREVAGITATDLASKEWAARLGVIFSEIGQPIIRATGHKGRSVPIRAWTAKLRKRLETDIAERERIAELKNALAERVYQIQRIKSAKLAKSRAIGGAARAAQRCGRTFSRGMEKESKAVSGGLDSGEITLAQSPSGLRMRMGG
jgi:hypothetical protein